MIIDFVARRPLIFNRWMNCDHSDKYICSIGYISSVQVRKTIRCGVVYLTKQKEELLNREYDNFQHFLQTGKDLGVYSAHKQQAKRFYKVIKKGKEYPISIRNDSVNYPSLTQGASCFIEKTCPETTSL